MIFNAVEPLSPPPSPAVVEAVLVEAEVAVSVEVEVAVEVESSVEKLYMQTGRLSALATRVRSTTER